MSELYDSVSLAENEKQNWTDWSIWINCWAIRKTRGGVNALCLFYFQNVI